MHGLLGHVFTWGPFTITPTLQPYLSAYEQMNWLTHATRKGKATRAKKGSEHRATGIRKEKGARETATDLWREIGRLISSVFHNQTTCFEVIITTKTSQVLSWISYWTRTSLQNLPLITDTEPSRKKKISGTEYIKIYVQKEYCTMSIFSDTKLNVCFIR
jgi:hypothetical protein